MTVPRAELLRRRRCLGLRVAIVFGVLLAVWGRDWAVAGVALAGIALAAVTYWRVCRKGRRPVEPDPS
jgi:O-antigen/teichoic acid export membrane protein